MKIIITKRSNGRNRVQHDYSDEKLITDQTHAKELTMASIIKKLEKGIMPATSQGEPLYTSDLGVRNLQDVIERQKETTDLFYSLPIEIRDHMGHDINNFESFIFDEQNLPLLQKYGLITQRRDNHQELVNAINALKPDANPSSGAQK